LRAHRAFEVWHKVEYRSEVRKRTLGEIEAAPSAQTRLRDNEEQTVACALSGFMYDDQTHRPLSLFPGYDLAQQELLR
jgi:hypothetical protein